MFMDGDKLSDKIVEKDGDESVTKLAHKTIKSVTQDMENLSFNTAIAKMMELTNAIYKVNKVNKSVMEDFILLMAPITPHMCEELWEKMGHTEGIAYAKWPIYDESLLHEDEIEIVVQIMGKKRANIMVPVNATQDEVLAIAQKEL